MTRIDHRSGRLRFTLCALLLGSVGFSRAECLQYEPAVVELTGLLVRETHPGRPNYESIERGDEPETIWVLRLDQPVCVEEQDEMNIRAEGQTEVQMVLDSQGYEAHRHRMGSRVKVTGTLFHSHTGHHHKKLLLMVQTVGDLRARE